MVDSPEYFESCMALRGDYLIGFQKWLLELPAMLLEKVFESALDDVVSQRFALV